MPVCSYLVFTRLGQLQQVSEQLDVLPQCSTEKADGGELLMLLTETQSEVEEQALQERFRTMEEIQCLVLTFGALEEAVQ